jgi:hypothetical protein
MTIATYLNQKFLTSKVQIWLYEYNHCMRIIADTTVEILQQSTNEGFRQLEVVTDFKTVNSYVVIVIKPHLSPKNAPNSHF